MERNFPKEFVRVGLLGCLLLATPLVSAQSDNLQASTSPGFTVGGVVVNSVTGDPVRRALVQITNLADGPWSTLTDSEGKFQFTHITVNDVVLAARKPGFFSAQELHPESPFPSGLFHVDANTTSAVIKLFPEGIVTGRVATAKREPIEDSPVRVFQQRILDGRKRWVQRSQSTTDEDGQFRIANLQPGQYLLSTGPMFGVGRRRVRGKGTSRQEQISNTFYPGVPEMDAATPITVVSGQQTQADFSLKPEPVFKVSGVVSGFLPATPNAPQVATRTGEPLAAPVRFDPQTGKFDVELPAGSYALMIRTPDGEGNLLSGDLPLTVNSDIENVTLTLGSPMVMPIRVQTRATSGSPVAPSGGVVNFSFAGSYQIRGGPRRMRTPVVQVRLISSENRLEDSEFQADSNATDGSFAIRNFVAGRYTVDLQPNPPWYVQSATSGNVDVLREELVLSPGRRPDPLDIVLRDDGAMISGTIKADGQPAIGSVLLIPEQQSAAQIRVMAAAPAGDFIFDRVPPGEYKLVALDTVSDVEFRNVEALGAYLSNATRITVEAGQQASVSVERVTVGK
jgi:Carboxypeptidase regulatory-like domain